MTSESIGEPSEKSVVATLATVIDRSIFCDSDYECRIVVSFSDFLYC